MKNLIKIAFAITLTLTVAAASAQKMGRINVQSVLVAMPEATKMQQDLETIRQDFASNLETMQVELNNKMNDYQQNQATMTDTIRSMKQKEMQDLDSRMQQFEQSAMQEIQSKQTEMLQPIIAKVREAISTEAKAGGYSVVFDESAGAMVYYDEATVIDLTAAVKSRLGI